MHEIRVGPTNLCCCKAP